MDEGGGETITYLPTPEEIRRLRKKAGLSQRELARRAGVSQALIARLERGTINPRMSTLRKILDAINESLKERVTAKTVMHTPVITLHPDDNVCRAVKLMDHYGISQIPVIDYEGRLLGTIYETSLLKLLAHSESPNPCETKISEVMEDPLPVVSPSTSVSTIIALLTEHPALLVIEKGIIQGIITKIDIIRMRLLHE